MRQHAIPTGRFDDESCYCCGTTVRHIIELSWDNDPEGKEVTLIFFPLKTFSSGRASATCSAGSVGNETEVHGAAWIWSGRNLPCPRCGRFAS